MKSVDIVGIVSEIGEKEQLTLKSGAMKVRKSVQLVDDSEKSIGVTLWGDEMCDKCDLAVGE